MQNMGEERSKEAIRPNPTTCLDDLLTSVEEESLVRKPDLISTSGNVKPNQPSGFYHQNPHRQIPSQNPSPLTHQQPRLPQLLQGVSTGTGIVHPHNSTQSPYSSNHSSTTHLQTNGISMNIADFEASNSGVAANNSSVRGNLCQQPISQQHYSTINNTSHQQQATHVYQNGMSNQQTAPNGAINSFNSNYQNNSYPAQISISNSNGNSHIVNPNQQSAIYRQNSQTINMTGNSNNISNSNNNPINTTHTTQPSIAFDPQRKLQVQNQLYLLLHVQKCLNSGNSDLCTVRHCSTMREVFSHLMVCTMGRDCNFSHCASSQQILAHFKSCNIKCEICAPFKSQRVDQNAQINALQQQSLQNQHHPQMSAQQNQIYVGQRDHNNVQSNNQIQGNNTYGNQYASSALSNGLTQQGVISNSVNPSEPADWRDNVSLGQRNHLVRKIVAAFSLNDTPALNQQELFEFAQNFEKKNFASAVSREDYFHKLAEKCYKINKEVEEKRKLQINNLNTNLTSNTNEQSNTALKNESVVKIEQADNARDINQLSASSEPSAKSEALTLSNALESSGADKNDLKSSPKNTNASSSESMGSVGTLSFSSTFSNSSGSTQKLPNSIPTGIVGTSKSFNKSLSYPKIWTREELCRNLLNLHRFIRGQEEALPFLEPVDPVILNIPDYYKIIKHPMDLSTIQTRLEEGLYEDPWAVIDDFWLMFQNAWLYNKKNSRVYRFCSKLAETFEKHVDRHMQNLGLCCGQNYIFQPQVLYCTTSNLCPINRDGNYFYCEKHASPDMLFLEKYYICEKCFTEFPDQDTVKVLCDMNQPPILLEKKLFRPKKNNEKEPEKFVECCECGRRWHQICALHMDEIWPSGFVCKTCLKDRPRKRPDNPYNAKRLTNTKLGSFLEKRVNDFLKKKDAGAGEVTIRVLYSGDKVIEVKPLMRSRFCDTGTLAEQFPYRSKAIFAFQEIDGVDVCFFGLYVQEYGDECPRPNQRRIYISYLDSVFFFRPYKYRTDVYHEILVGYLQYVKHQGYTMAHIWACPPSEGDDYIFHMHPPDQKIPKPKRLQEWYQKMLEKALIERIICDYKDIFNDAIRNCMDSPAEIPYFEGDFWSNTLEDIIKEVEKASLDDNTTSGSGGADCLLVDEDNDDEECDEEDNGCVVEAGGVFSRQSSLSKKKPKKRKLNKRPGTNGSSAGLGGVGGSGGSGGGNSSTAPKRKKSTNAANSGANKGVQGSDPLLSKVYSVMDKHKEVFFNIRLVHQQAEATLPPIHDPDHTIHSELMDGRDNFLAMSREKHLEFSSLRRAKFASMVLLYELHTENRNNFAYTCNSCNSQIKRFRFHCNTCGNYDLCEACNTTQKHPHPLIKLPASAGDDDDSTGGGGLDDKLSAGGLGLRAGSGSSTGSAGGSLASAQNSDLSVQEVRRKNMEKVINMMQHAANCRDANCQQNGCQRLKLSLTHMRGCEKKAHGSCQTCKQLIALIYYHAKFCEDAECCFPYCKTLKNRVKQQQQQQRFQQAKNLRRRIAHMHKLQSGGGSIPAAQSSSNPTVAAPPATSSPMVPRFVAESPAYPNVPSTGAQLQAAVQPGSNPAAYFQPAGQFTGAQNYYQNVSSTHSMHSSSSTVTSQYSSHAASNPLNTSQSYPGQAHPPAMQFNLADQGQPAARVLHQQQQQQSYASMIQQQQQQHHQQQYISPTSSSSTVGNNFYASGGAAHHTHIQSAAAHHHHQHPGMMAATSSTAANPMLDVNARKRRELLDQITIIKQTIEPQHHNTALSEFLKQNPQYIEAFRNLREEQKIKASSGAAVQNRPPPAPLSSSMTSNNLNAAAEMDSVNMMLRPHFPQQISSTPIQQQQQQQSSYHSEGTAASLGSHPMAAQHPILAAQQQPYVQRLGVRPTSNHPQQPTTPHPTAANFYLPGAPPQPHYK